jgi:hypothetical protein
MGLTLPKRLYKQPRESRLFSIDFSELLVSGEALSSISTGPTALPSGLTVGSGTISGTTVQFRVSSGTDGTAYSIHTVVATDQSNTLEGDGLLLVHDITKVSATSYSFASAYCELADMEAVFGRDNIEAWADINNDANADDIAQQQARAANLATSKMNLLFRRSDYAIPFSGTDRTITDDWTAKWAGLILYDLRGSQDMDEDGKPFHKYSGLKNRMKAEIRDVVSGKYCLDLAVKTKGANAPIVA